ncbi:MAG: S4 domain-containing protein [Armatimonadota bacterium]|nr:S4 domain-containing protein [Armatimonadota bacterium]MDR7451678.1 S4 domain-containing protein [Armatimonadota bacterium]MDR7465704.1 S4 domain-containing protein [Armatimonadota bacterium]MDR7493613.1 S4 domain-containing protein [Armatimonadota bacterium]MDR7499483.1 S4 domain-containing protein [Armatimonadota bacterium]
MRLDKFLQVSRLIKRRAVANRLCDHGRIRVNGVVARPSAAVRPGDVITISRGDRRVVAKVVSETLAEILSRTTVEEWRA